METIVQRRRAHPDGPLYNAVVEHFSWPVTPADLPMPADTAAAEPYHLRQTTPPATLTGRPYLCDAGDEVALHFDFATVQSTMRRSDPHGLGQDYTRAMMAFLLFVPAPRRITMIGLGGGTLAKYCYRHLPEADFTTVEINPEVIALRDEFCIPADDERFRVICGDGARHLRAMMEPADVLLIDGFDLTGQPEALCSAAFYADCQRRLGPHGVLAANLWAEDKLLDTCVSRLRACFGDQVVIIDSEDQGNKVALACKGPGFPPSARVLAERAGALASQHPIDLAITARKIARKLDKRRRKAPFQGRAGATDFIYDYWQPLPPMENP